MWLQKDEYTNSNKDRPLDGVSTYPVYSLKQCSLLDPSPLNSSEICIKASSLGQIKQIDSANKNESTGSIADSITRSSVCVNAEKETESGCVRSILTILDSFKIEDLKDEKNRKQVTVVESRVDVSGKEPLKEKKGAFNEESIIDGMSQGDRLQQIKSMRRHARATTTGALKYLFFSLKKKIN